MFFDTFYIRYIIHNYFFVDAKTYVQLNVIVYQCHLGKVNATILHPSTSLAAKRTWHNCCDSVLGRCKQTDSQLLYFTPRLSDRRPRLRQLHHEDRPLQESLQNHQLLQEQLWLPRPVPGADRCHLLPAGAAAPDQHSGPAAQVSAGRTAAGDDTVHHHGGGGPGRQRVGGHADRQAVPGAQVRARPEADCGRRVHEGEWVK